MKILLKIWLTLLAVEGAVAVTCIINQRVVSNQCVACPIGYARAAGDDGSGADTQCTNCAEGYRVSAKGSDTSTPGTCTACPTGFTTASASSTAAGTLVQCLSCAEGYYVSAKGADAATAGTCAVCRAGHTTASALSNGAGTVFTSPGKGCLSCAEGYYVSAKGADAATAGTCAVCPTGHTTASALSSSNGALATCSATSSGTQTCTANQFVQSNVCINCPTNSESVVGSDALPDCKVKAGFYIATKSVSAANAANLVISAAPANFYAPGGASASAQDITAAMYTACPFGGTSSAESDALTDCTPATVGAAFIIHGGTVRCATNYYGTPLDANDATLAVAAKGCTACPFGGTTSGTGSTDLTDCTPACGNTGTLKTLAQGGTCVCAATNYGKPGNANPFLTVGAATQGCTAAGAFNIPPSGVSTIANTIGFTAHGLSDGDALIYNTGGGVVAAGLTNGQTYFVIDKTGDTFFSIATTPGGSAIGITGTGNNAQFFTPAGTGVPSTGVAWLMSNLVTTAVAHGFSVGDQVKVYSGGGAKLEDAGTAIADGATYYIQSTPAATTFMLAATPGGSQLVLTGGNAASYFTYAGVQGINIPNSAVTVTTDTITFAAHKLSNGDQVTYYHGGGSAAASLTNGATYFVRDAATNTFKVSATLGGSAIDITGTGNNAQHFTYVTAGSTTNVAYPGGACPANTEVTTLATDADGITVLADCKVKGSASTTCNANFYVSALGGDATTAGTCTACPSKSYIAAGSDSTSAGALNRCTSRACAADQYVNAGTCKNCPTGFTRPAGDDSSGADTECTKCADGYYVSAKGADTSTPGTCTACATGFSTTGAESHVGGMMFNTKELGCLKTAPGYFLKMKGPETGTTANSVVEACPAGYTADSQSATSSGGVAFANAEFGCLKTAPGYFLKVKGKAGGGTSEHAVVEACPAGYTADSQSATNSGTEFANAEFGCLKTAPGYFLKTKGSNVITTDISVVEACPTGKTTAGGADATNGGTALTAVTGCLLVAANYYVSEVGADASTAGTVTACASGSTNAAGDSSVGGFAGVLTQCDIAAATGNSDENKYICLDPSKFTASKQVTFSGYTTSCDTWIDAAQGSGQVFNGITFDSTFDATAQTTTVQNGLKMYAGPYGGNGLECCSDGKSAAFKNHTYFCKDPNDWLPDKTYTFSGGGTSTCTEWLEFDATGLTNEDFTVSWSCDGKSDAIRQKVQNEGAEIIGCCGSGKKSACWQDPTSAPPPPSVNTTSPPPPTPPPPQPPSLILDDDDHAAGLAGILMALVATTVNILLIL